MHLKNKNCVVVGLGITGVAVSRFLKTRGAGVTAVDMANEQKLGNTPDKLRHMGIRVECGPHRMNTFESADLIVLSPGVPHTIDPVCRAREKGAKVIGEIELASRFIREPIIAVTGTNGKTTVTTLLGKMLEKSGFSVFVGGNIGNPLIDYIEKEQPADKIVLEVSSFQLDTIDTFKPNVAVLLNITEDHMDRYPDFNAYAQSKAKIFENQNDQDTAVINGSDKFVLSVTENIKSRRLIYGGNLSDSMTDYTVIKDKQIDFHLNGFGIRSLDMTRTALLGKHNTENVAAACLAALAAGGNWESIESALYEFKGLPHRIEYVATVNGVKFFDDSKGTSIDAVARALEMFTEPVILIMGGRNKGTTFNIIEDLVKKHVKKLIVIGEASEAIEAALGHVKLTEKASGMEDAVNRAYRYAKPGDVVLLSPACSSFDMYRNYSERGEHFCQTIKQLLE